MTKPAPTKPLAILLAALALACTASLAHARAPETMPAPVRTAVQPMPETLKSFRRVTALGTTKPAGATLDERRGTTPQLEAADGRIARLVRTAVCTGC